MKKDPFILLPRTNLKGPSIRAHNLTKGQCILIRKIVCNQFMDSDDYKLAQGTGAFLQGYEEPRTWSKVDDGWVMVEFWSSDMEKIQKFIDHINSELKLGCAPDCHMCGKKSDLMKVEVDGLVSYICRRCNRKLCKGIQRNIHSIGTKRKWRTAGWMRHT